MKTEVTLKGGQKTRAILARIGANLANGATVNVGFLAGATYPDGLSVAQVAFWNEFGTSKAPPRPFFRGMIAEKSPTWGKSLAVAAKSTGYDSQKTMALMGEGIKDQLVASIVAFSDPPNAPYTIAKKGFNKPLVDTGVMQRTPDFEVKSGT